MRKTDMRHYNISSNRNLSIEMNLWCLLSGKLLQASGCTYDNKPVYGIIIDLKYEPGRTKNLCRVTLDNGTEYALQVKYGRIVADDKVSVL